MSRPPNDAAFSLVEALVALAVFAMAGVALVQLQSQSLHTFTRVETRALADLAAQNRLTQIASAPTAPQVGAREEEVLFAGRTWRMQVTVVGATDARTRRVSVAVGPAGEAPASTSHAFVMVREGAT